VIVYYLMSTGLWRRFDRGKWRYFLGQERDPLVLSRAYPPWRSLSLLGLVCRPGYARGAVRWLEYRIALYEGRQG
jgi:hypothetical protein